MVSSVFRWLPLNWSQAPIHPRMAKRKRKRGGFKKRKCFNDECLEFLHPRTKVCPSCKMNQHTGEIRTSESQTRPKKKSQSLPSSKPSCIPKELKDRGWCLVQLKNGEWRIVHRYCSLGTFLDVESVLQHIESTKKEDCPYDILGVGKNVSMKHLKKAWLGKCRENHPDKVRGDTQQKENATVYFQKISQAYECLKDPLKRWHYDVLGCKCGLASDDSILLEQMNPQALTPLLEKLEKKYSRDANVPQSSQENERILPNVSPPHEQLRDSQNEPGNEPGNQDGFMMLGDSSGSEIIRKLKRVKKAFDDLKQKNDTLTMHNNRLEKETTRLKEDTVRLKRDNAELRKCNGLLRKENSNLKRNTTELQNENMGLRKENEDYTSRMKEIDSMMEWME